MKFLFLIFPLLLSADLIKVSGSEDKINYSTKVDLFKFDSSKVAVIAGQTFDVQKKDVAEEKAEIKYILKFKGF